MKVEKSGKHFSTFFSKVPPIILKRIIFAVVIAFGGLLLSMNDEQRFTFAKAERVTGDKRIEALFARGCPFMAYPFRVVYLEKEGYISCPVSVLITVPKKRIKSAARRNRVKRLAREAYRLNKHLFNRSLLPENGGMDIAFIYVRDETADYATVEKGVQKALLALNRQLINEREECQGD